METGRVINGRFQLGEVAGYGGMGAVYRARDLTNGQTVAVKLIHAHDDQRRFLREAEVLAQLTHPGIVRYVDHGVVDRDGYFLAMEWVEGEDLAKKLGRGGVSIEQSLLLVRAVADAIGAAHARGIVHRDLKPSNVILVERAFDRVKILDFGIARLTQTQVAALTNPGAVIGTPSFMAPEQARGRPNLDARADVFTLGCVFFYCLTGRPPFVGNDPIAVLARIILEEAPRVSSLVPDVPGPIDALVAAMLAKDPEKRPASGLEVAHAVERILRVSNYSGEDTVPQPGPLSSATQQVRLEGLDDGTPVNLDQLVSVVITNIAHEPKSGELAELADIAREHGARLEPIAGGALVLTLSGDPTDGEALASRASRVASRVRDIEGTSVAVSTGHTGQINIGDVIERAAGMLASPGNAVVRLDAETASLLPELDEAKRELGNGILSASLGMIERAYVSLERALEASELAGVQELAALALLHLGIVARRRGKLVEARDFLERSLVAFLVLEDRTHLGLAKTYLAQVHRARKKLSRAEREAIEGAETLTAAAPRLRPFALATLAHVRLAQGRTEDALRSAAQAVELLDADMEAGKSGGDTETFVRLVHVESLLASGDRRAARRAGQSAKLRVLALAEEIGDAERRQAFLENLDENARTLEIAESLTAQ